MAEGGFLSRIGGSIKGGGRPLAVIVGVVLVAVVYYVFFSGGPLIPTSEVRNLPGGIQTVQGGNPLTPNYTKALSADDDRRAKEAAEQGKSALPTIVAQPTKPTQVPDESTNKQGDLGLLPRPEPPVASAPPVTIPPLPSAPMPVQPQAEAPNDPKVEVIKRQMEAIAKLGVWPPADVKYYMKVEPPQQAGTNQTQAAPAGIQTASNVIDAASGLRMPMPGTILYAEMISEANSDAPGPVLARIVQGDLAGATLIGSFQAQRDKLVISFNTLTIERTRAGDEVNKSVPVTAVAVDSTTVGTGLATDVDRHLLTNIGFTAAAAFAQGFGQAIAQSGSTTTSGVYGATTTNPTLTTSRQLLVAGGSAAGAAGQAFNQAYGNRPVTVKVASGTPMGVLFLPSGNR